MMKTIPLSLQDVMLIENTIFKDDRGSFTELFNQDKFFRAVGKRIEFVQDNCSFSTKNVLRGLHYQINRPQGKLIHVVKGTIFDVAVDLRRSSATFGQWLGKTLSACRYQQLWLPPGLAHGFMVLSETAEVHYKVTDYWSPADERCIAWDDPDLAIAWPLNESLVLSEKDKRGDLFKNAVFYT